MILSKHKSEYLAIKEREANNQHLHSIDTYVE